jgi:hypothetical protein
MTYFASKKAMKDSNWIKTEQMLEDLRRDADNEHQYAHWLGGILRTTHWIEFDSDKNMFGDSMDWSEYFWYTEAEFLGRYAGHLWKREH